MKKQKPLKVKIVLVNKSPQEIKFRLLQAYRTLLSEEDILDFLKSKQKKDIKKFRPEKTS